MWLDGRNLDEVVVMRRDEIGNLGFVGISDDEGDAGEGGDFFGSALSVAAGDENFCGGILRMNFADGVASLGVGRGSDSAGVDDDKFGVNRRNRRGTSAAEKLALDGSTVGLRGTAAELFDVERRHGEIRI